MLRRLEDMPSGTIGFEAVAKVEDDDWEDHLEPVLPAEIAEGERCGFSTSSARSRAWRVRR
jgi:hypothetical protein